MQLLTENDRSDKKDFLESLQFLTGFMQGLKQKSPYTISLLLQLETDLASLGGLNPTGHVTVPIDRITEVCVLDARLPPKLPPPTIPTDRFIPSR